MMLPFFLRICLVAFTSIAGGVYPVYSRTPQEKDSLISLLNDRSVSEKEKCILSYRLSEKYYRTNLDSSNWYARNGYNLSKKIDFDSGILINATRIGNIAIKEDSIGVARKFFFEAERLATKLGESYQLLNIYLKLGYIFDLESKYDKSMEYYMQGLRLAEKKRNRTYIPMYYNNIAIIHDIVGNSRKAIEYYLTSARLFKELDSIQLYANTLTNLGGLYFAMQQYDSSEYYYDLALPIHKRLHNYYGLTNLYIGLGDNSSQKEQKTQSLKYYLKAQNLLDSIGVDFLGSKNYVKVEIFFKLGRNLLEIGRFADARKYLLTAHKDAKLESMLSFQVYTAQSISDLYYKTGLIDSAYLWHKTFKLLDDSLNLDKNRNLIKIQEMKFEYEKEKELQQLLDKRREEAKRNTELLFTTVILTLFLITLIILIFLLYQRNKAIQSELKRRTLQLEKEKLQIELDHKSRELTTSVMYLLKKNEMIEDITPKLRDASEGLDSENQKQIRTIIHELESSTSKDAWKEFEIRFQEVHGDFYTRLSSEYPQLSPNELKLCAFLRLNMSSKDIASIIFRTEHSIKIARHRLRKKLDLAHDENIVTFLARF